MCFVGEIYLNHQNIPKKDLVLCWEPDYFNKHKLYNHLEKKKKLPVYHAELEENSFWATRLISLRVCH
jgi:hypothetical protein